jgi:hypothetical protein
MEDKKPKKVLPKAGGNDAWLFTPSSGKRATLTVVGREEPVRQDSSESPALFADRRTSYAFNSGFRHRMYPLTHHIP